MNATPRPWRYQDRYVDVVIWGQTVHPGKWDEHCPEVAILHPTHKDDMCPKYNAELIVRAVNAFDAMREALGELITAYDSKRMMPPDKFPPLWEKARAALALAKG